MFIRCFLLTRYLEILFHRKPYQVFASRHAGEPFRYLDKFFKFLIEVLECFTKLFKHSVDHLKPEEKSKSLQRVSKARPIVWQVSLCGYVITWPMPFQLATVFKDHIFLIFFSRLCFN